MSNSSQLEENKALVREFFVRLEKGDLEEAFGLFADDATWYALLLRDHRPYREIAAMTALLLEAMPDGMRFELGPITAEDARVAVIVTSRATLINGGTYDNAYHFLFELRDKRIQRAWEFNDTHHVLQALDGVIDFSKLAAPGESGG
jgi:ketosteroid isomerase-like protein